MVNEPSQTSSTNWQMNREKEKIGQIIFCLTKIWRNDGRGEGAKASQPYCTNNLGYPWLDKNMPQLKRGGGGKFRRQSLDKLCRLSNTFKLHNYWINFWSYAVNHLETRMIKSLCLGNTAHKFTFLVTKERGTVSVNVKLRCDWIPKFVAKFTYFSRMKEGRGAN